MRYWRTITGLEVDFVCGDGEIATEVKISSHIGPNDLKGLIAFQEEYSPRRAVLVCTEKSPRRIKTPHGYIEVLPIHTFLQHLWAGKII